jgi:hypothetical protein
MSMGFLHEPGSESCKERKSLLFHCMDCNPHFIETESKLFEGKGS